MATFHMQQLNVRKPLGPRYALKMERHEAESVEGPRQQCPTCKMLGLTVKVNGTFRHTCCGRLVA